jgi:hypothetical protein
MEPNNKTLQLLDHIGNELKLLWWQMDAYQELFLIAQEQRQSLLKNTAPGFFAITQVSLAESILMRVFRLMDPAKSCGDENSSIQHLHDVLSADDTNQSSLRTCITQVRSDWKLPNGPYAKLQAIRNKLLAHNDFSERAALETNQLWMNLSSEEFESTQRLAGRLWELNRQCNRVLRGTDVIEPVHSSLENRPSLLLKHLCASRYLDSLVGDAPGHVAKLRALEANEMGSDAVRSVFAPLNASMNGDQHSIGKQQ